MAERLRAQRLFKAQLRQLWGYLPPGSSAAERMALITLYAIDDGGEGGAVVSHADLGELSGFSPSTSYRATKALERAGYIASKPCFREDEDHSQTANSYAVLAFEALERELVVDLAPAHVTMTRGRSVVSNQQKEIPEETVAARVSPVDNCPPVDDLTPEDRAALAAVGRGLKFPEPENVPEPVRGSPLELVCARWGWPHYGQVWQLLQKREGQQLAHVAAPALAALLRRSAAQVPNPAGYVLGTMRTMAKAGPGLRSIRPAPDTPAPGSLAELELQFATLRGLRDSSVGDADRYGQLCIAVHELGRRIVARKAKAS
jgi:hypothetical protein